MLFFNNQKKWSRLFFNPQAWQNNFLMYVFFVAFTFFLLIWGEVIWALFSIKDVTFLSLHYSIYLGVDWLGGPGHLFVFPGIATLIFVLNYILANIFYEKKKILSYFLIGFCAVLQLFLLIATSLIIYINWTAPGV